MDDSPEPLNPRLDLTTVDRVLAVRISVDDLDEQHSLALTQRLRLDLLELDVDAVELITGNPARDAKSGFGPVVGLQVRLGLAVLTEIVRRIRDWISRNRCAVEVTLDGDSITIVGGPASRQDQVISAWLARHAADAE